MTRMLRTVRMVCIAGIVAVFAAAFVLPDEVTKVSARPVEQPMPTRTLTPRTTIGPVRDVVVVVARPAGPQGPQQPAK